MVINKKYDNYLVKLFFTDKWHFNLSNLNKYKRHYKKKDKYQNIINYIENRYDDSESFKETLYRICHNIEIRPVCQECGNKVEFIGKGNVLFRSFCSLSCSNGSKESIKKKQESDRLKNNGELGWVKSNRDPQKIENRKNTLIRKYGSLEIANKEIVKLAKISHKANTGYDNPMQNPEIKEKWKLSLYNKYGVNNPMKSEIIRSRRINTLRNNHTFNSSKSEEIAKELLENLFNDLIYQYTEKRYPFMCDFYIPSLDLFIEYNESWTHGAKPFNNKDQQCINKLNIWKEKSISSEYYKNAIYTWTIRDVNKRNTAKENNLNFIELWSIKDVENFINLYTSNLEFSFNIEYIRNEFNYFKKLKSSLNNNCRKTNIVKYYQQNSFYYHELQLWKNPQNRIKIILNRLKYLNKSISEITQLDILDGFKRSGMHYGYSHFNSGLIKWFHEIYNSKICYDPCGGWGHRILGSLGIDLYIYNDLSKSTFENCKQMCEELNISNVILFNNDCTKFDPNYEYDTMFTCPPYFNLEHYECGDFESLEDYNNFIDSLFNLFYQKDSCKTFGLVIREDMIDLNKYVPSKSYCLNLRKSVHLTNTKSKDEYLYIYQK